MKSRTHYSQDLSRDKPLSFRWKADYRKLSEVIELPSCKSAKAEKALASIVHDAAITANAEPDRRISYSRRKEFYRASDRYLGSDYGYDTVVPAVDALVAAGLLVEHDKRPEGSLGIQSSFKPSPELAGLLLPTAMKRPQELIRLKDAKGNLVSYRDTERTMRDRKFLEAVNKHISASDIQLHAPAGVRDGDLIRFGEHTVYTDMNELFRVYNGAWTLGGRMYGGWWQQVKSEDRQHFIIDGGETVELDYEMLHPRLLYAAVGERLEGDAYSIRGWDRKVCKRAFNVLLNANNYNSAKGAILPYVDGDEKAAVALIKDIKSKHKSVADKFHSGAGLKLQYMDSEMAKAVVHELTVKNGVTVLPIHDSFIVRQEHKNDLVDCMERAFLKATSTVGNPVTVSKTYPQNYPHMEGRALPEGRWGVVKGVASSKVGGVESDTLELESDTGRNKNLGVNDGENHMALGSGFTRPSLKTSGTGHTGDKSENTVVDTENTNVVSLRPKEIVSRHIPWEVIDEPKIVTQEKRHHPIPYFMTKEGREEASRKELERQLNRPLQHASGGRK